MNDRELDRLLHDATPPPGPRAEVVEAIAGSIAGSMRPARPLPAPFVLAAELVLICAATGFAGAAPLGLFGMTKMTLPERCGVLGALAILTLLVAPELVRTMIPGSRRRMSSGMLLATVALSMEAVLFACFRDFHTSRFFHAGIVCLSLGTLTALVTGLFAWVVLRRGFAVDQNAAGLVGGTLAGIAGVTMLELHCPNFQTAHLLVWHVGVLLLSAGLGMLVSRRRS